MSWHFLHSELLTTVSTFSSIARSPSFIVFNLTFSNSTSLHFDHSTPCVTITVVKPAVEARATTGPGAGRRGSRQAGRGHHSLREPHAARIWHRHEPAAPQQLQGLIAERRPGCARRAAPATTATDARDCDCTCARTSRCSHLCPIPCACTSLAVSRVPAQLHAAQLQHQLQRLQPGAADSIGSAARR